MAEWITPVTDRTVADTTAARREQSNAENNKGALNYQDLNRIEGNYRYLLEKLESDSFFIPHRYRNYEETTIEKTEVQPELGYTPVEYIKSSGAQYIDTGTNPDASSYRVAMKFMYHTEHNSTSLFGNHSSVPYSMSVYGSRPQFYVGSGSGGIDCGPQTELNTDYELDVTVSGGKITAIWNGETYSADYSGTLYTDLPVFIFGTNNNGSLNESGNGYILYYWKMYNNGVLVRDYIPVKDPSGVACLYDKVSKSFYRNAGTGEFTAGAEIPVAPITEYAEVKRTYTDWQERNIPWLSEIDRIRANYNALVRLFLIGLGLPISGESNYLAYEEVNNWERIALTGKEMFENMAQEYIPCGTIDSGGDRLL